MAGRIGKRIYASAEWRAVRLVVFKRDGHACFQCGRRSGLECDHIEPIRKGGDWFALSNLRTVCRGCHIKLTASSLRRTLTDPRQQLRDMSLACTY